MTFHIVISVIIVLVSVVFFDYEFSLLRGIEKPKKVFGQTMFSIWFAFIAGLALSVPIIYEVVKHELSLGFVGQIVTSGVVYVLWFLTARWLYRKVMQSIYHGTVTGDYRCKAASDDADIEPD